MSTSRITKYASAFNIGLQNTFVYRWNYFLRALFGLVPLAGTVFLWSAVFKERGGGLHGYDYGSIMHYPKNAFAMDPGQPTVIPKGGQAIGQRDGLSAGDIATVAQIYA